MCSVQKVREVMKNRDRLCIMCILGGAISCSTVKAKFFFCDEHDFWMFYKSDSVGKSWGWGALGFNVGSDSSYKYLHHLGSSG